ncbi:hypothetical protein [Inhella gelatinilytica]|uniref:Platelet-activating factor acetylhydrolase n=1 Tax=Inhella gelatinilytica TaxID=2795030 RepID=A0A931IWQ0_9BURK|nr:hypothetical protein [Inhella gelatinilytica]MBH9552028.1 hypothetical protein [Inhella gelatinilytica]
MLNRRTLLALTPAFAASSLGAQVPRERVAPLRRTFPDPGSIHWAWTDDTRQRTLPLRLWRPEAAEPVPLVLFSHGLGGSVEAGRLWAQAWAAAGIATLNLQHPGSDTTVAREGGMALRRAANLEQLLARGAGRPR